MSRRSSTNDTSSPNAPESRRVGLACACLEAVAAGEEDRATISIFVWSMHALSSQMRGEAILVRRILQWGILGDAKSEACDRESSSPARAGRRAGPYNWTRGRSPPAWSRGRGRICWSAIAVAGVPRLLPMRRNRPHWDPCRVFQPLARCGGRRSSSLPCGEEVDGEQ